MSRFAVVRRRGHAWDHARGRREQDAWPEHAKFMDAWAEDGFGVLGGPLGDGERFLHGYEGMPSPGGIMMAWFGSRFSSPSGRWRR